MNLLLDTHIFLWYLSDDPSLPTAVRETIRDPSHRVYLSAASIWEAVIKYELGKLPLPEPRADYLPRERAAHGIDPLPIEEAALVRLAELPPLHKDPFDRMLIAQALQHSLALVTMDSAIRAYSVPLLPA